MNPALVQTSVKSREKEFTLKIESLDKQDLTHEMILIGLIGTIKSYCERHNIDPHEFYEELQGVKELTGVLPPVTKGEA